MMCVKCGPSARVYEMYCTSTLMDWHPYWENGEYHVHNLNLERTHYKCDKGHEFSVINQHLCPVKDCDFNKGKTQ